MKKVLLAVLMILSLFLVGCGTITTDELPRYRVKVVEIITGEDEGEFGYIVSKDGYTIGGIYALDTEDNFLMGEIIYVVIVDEYTAVPFWEWLEDNK